MMAKPIYTRLSVPALDMEWLRLPVSAGRDETSDMGNSSSIQNKETAVVVLLGGGGGSGNTGVRNLIQVFYVLDLPLQPSSFNAHAYYDFYPGRWRSQRNQAYLSFSDPMIRALNFASALVLDWLRRPMQILPSSFLASTTVAVHC